MTVKVVVLVTPFSDAEIVVEPGFTAEASPRVLIVATVGLDENHRTWPVTFRVELLL